eukprot:8405599-Alexandrium_andersonii.AAC.1
MSFIDDMVVPFGAPEASLLPRAAEEVVQVIEEVTQHHGLQLHYTPTKTAALLAPRGRGSRAVRQTYYSGADTSILCCTALGERKLPV